MPVFVVHGVEHVYDAFDEYEHPNRINVRVSERSLGTALERAPRLLQSLVDEQRAGFRSSGMFIAQLVRVEDEAGHVLFQDLEAISGLLRYFGGDLEDYRDVASTSVFLSYSHRDEDFATRFRDGIAAKGFRLWFDRAEWSTEVTLLRFGSTEPGDEIKEVLTRAIERAHRVVLLLSSNSVGSNWVEWEVDLALRVGQDRHKFLSCAALETGILADRRAWVGRAVGSDNVHDFTRWQEPSAFEASLRRFMEEVLGFREA
ncbi:MAG: toll/interleukin-1 receptor domain-containing protein [Candidatus Methylomirabilaceae bacterium]